MRQFIDLTVVGAALTVGLLLTGGAAAETLSAPPSDQVDAVGDSGCGEPLTGGELHELTGGQNTHVESATLQGSSASLSAPMSSNTLNGPNTTGSNTIFPGAFSNINGIAPVIQNSGNLVTINSSIILNLYKD